MEMSPMMLQSQEITAPVPGAAAAVKNPSWLQRLSATPVLFADMLQEMLPPAQPGTGKAEMMLNTTQAGGVLSGTVKADVDVDGTLPDVSGGKADQSTDQVGSLLAQLLAMTGQLPADQSRLQPAGTDLPLQPMGNGPSRCPAVEPVAVPLVAVSEAQDTTFISPQPGQDAADSVVTTGMTALTGQAVTPERTAEDHSLPIGHHAADTNGDAGPAPRQPGLAAFDRVQVRTEAAAPLHFSAIKPTNEPVAPVKQAPATTDPVKFSVVGPAVMEGCEPQHQPAVDDTAENPARLMAEVVFADPSTRGGSAEGNGNRESGSKEKEKHHTPAIGVPAAHTPASTVSNRFSIQPKAEEPGNALRESILAQVKESIVSHDGKGNGTITVRLNPVDLGDLQINLRIENQRIKVEVISDNRTVRDALMGNLDNLKETFLKQNLNMERFDVSSGAGNGFGQGFREDRGDQRRISTLPFAEETVPGVTAREHGEDDWGVKDTSLVNLRL